ncbi:MAG: type secretion system secreted protein VgrG, partial [Solirubrobacteraceae bacterium]|nr:type secretion system secreted protein VgrG [Solirubrobacteraceae bacterium]
MVGRVLRRIVITLLAVLTAPGVAAAATPGSLSGTGIRVVGGREAIVHVTLAAAHDPDAAITAALRSQGARPLSAAEAAAFQTIGFRWPDARVAQSYNPAGEPVPGAAAALAAAQSTWSSVDGSDFRFTDAGVTSRCPSIWCADAPDGHNDVGWTPLPCGPASCLYGATLFEGHADRRGFVVEESDVVLSNDISGLGQTWHTDGSHPDVESLMLHEDGHVLGLNHVQDPSAVMYRALLEVRRELSASELAGITWLYPDSGPGHPFHPAHPAHPAHPPHPLPPAPKLSASTLASLPSALPDGAAMDGWFEGLDIDAAGDVSFGTAISTAGEPAGQAMFQRSAGGTLAQLARSGGAAPGGGAFGCCIIGRAGIGADATVAFGFAREPFDFPVGFNTGIYRRLPGAPLAAVVVPHVTQDPGGRTMRGAMDADVGRDGAVAFGAMIDDATGLPFSPDLSAGEYTAAAQGPL